MYQLRDWSMEIYGGDVFCFGDCYWNPRFVDGYYVHTSVALEAKVDNVGKVLHVRTYSGSHYMMDFADINVNAANETSDALYRMGAELDINECIALKEQAAHMSKQAVARVLKARELYVKMAGGNSAKEAYFKMESEALVEIPIRVHVGTFTDSVLVGRPGVCDWRFFPSQVSVQPYHWSDGLDAVYLENMGSDFMFKGTGRDILCRQGVVTRITKDMYQGEGLMSPDCVNGKSLLDRL